MSKFIPGTRVVYRTYNFVGQLGIVGGTIVSTRVSHQSINYWTSKEVLMVLVIFDDGCKAEHCANELYLEQDYDPEIPF